MLGGAAGRTPLFIVCSPQVRVGRTLVARLLIDFFLMEDREVAGFDFDAEPPSLADFLPSHTTIAEVGDIQGQMALFDRLILPDHVAKIVDLAPASLQQFFNVMGQIDFIDAARGRGIEPVALYIATPEPIAQRVYAGLQKSLPELVLVPVYNEAIAEGQRARRNFPLSHHAVSVPIQIPALPAHFYRYLEKPPFSFAGFRGTPPQDIPLDSYLELLRWMKRVFVEFRELELRLLLNDVRSSLKHGAG